MINDDLPDEDALDAFPLDPWGRDGPAQAPGNPAYRRHQMGHLLHRIGAVLPQWLDGEELVRACSGLEQTCWRALGYPKEPMFESDLLWLPRFLLVDEDGHPRDHDLSVPTEPLELAARMASLAPSPLPAYSPLGTNFAALMRLLNLTPFESQWLLWSYCVRHFGEGHLPELAWSDEAQTSEALALLFEMPVDAVRQAVASRRLHIWGFLVGETAKSAMPSTLADWFLATDSFTEVIVKPFDSDTELLLALYHLQALRTASR